MSERDNGGPAFPKTREAIIDSRSAGMTLRDWFAGQALASMTTRDMYYEGYSVQDIKAVFARQAYGIADAMIAERAK